MTCLFLLMKYDARCPICKTVSEIDKPMAAPMPQCPRCSTSLVRLYHAVPAVLYNAPGFYATDIAHFEKQVGRERAERFRAQRTSAEARASTGRLTPYEKALEAIE